MSAVKSRGNESTELSFVRLLRANKISGWRRHLAIFGKPDFVFRKQKIAVFIDGCFWHGCKKCRTIPKQNRVFWSDKIERNIKRDKLVTKELRKSDWTVLRFWEHQLKKNPQTVISRLRRIL